MNSRREEIIIVSIASILLIGVFGAIAYFDRPHADIGEDYGLEQVDISIDEATGNIVWADLPEGLIIFGEGATASIEVTVTNSDPDNDIDTIVVTIPGATITSSTYAWSESGEVHEWNESISSDSVTFTADTDYPGINHGGSTQYDTAGSEDDALDHDNDDNSSEGITLTVYFTAPTTEGLRTGANAIGVEVGDLITENQEPLTSFAPFPYPFWVASEGSDYIIMVLQETNVDLEVVYDGQTYFGATRASDFQTFEHGMKFYTAEGRAVAVLDKPTDGSVVKPAVRPKSNGLTGKFTIDVFTLSISDIASVPLRTAIVTDYMEDIPSTTASVVDLDMDSDGTYNNDDDDADGDGQVKTLDRDDRDRNLMEYAPTGLNANVDRQSVKVGESFVLTASSTDANNDAITYTWTVDKVPGWSRTGSPVTVVAEGELKEGETYVFTVKADDGHHPTKPTDTISIKIKEEEKSNLILIIAIVAIVIVIAIVAFSILSRRKGGEEDIEEKVQPPAESEEQAEEVIELPKDVVRASTTTEEQEVEEMDEIDEDEEEPAQTKEADDIENLEALAEDLDRSDTCPECGTTLRPTDLKCPTCGAEFDIELECPGCKSALNPTDKKCPGCGIEFIT